MQVLLFIISILLLSVAVTYQVRLLGLMRLADRVLSWFILASANIVFTTVVLSELNFVSSSGYLLAEFIVAIVSVLFVVKFVKSKSPPLLISIKLSDLKLSGPERTEGTVLWGFFIATLLVTLTSLAIAVLVPQNSYDGMTYHLSRIGYWLQNGTLRHYYTQEWRQVYMAPNAEILVLWTVAFLKSDIIANTIQWTAYCVTGLVIYRIARTMESCRRSALFAALVYLTLKLTVLEASTTQTDLVVTAFTLLFFYFYQLGLKESRVGYLVLSAISLGLAIGTKITIFYAGPAFIFTSLVLMRIYKARFSLYAKWLALCFAGILFFGSYNYILNYVHYENFFVPPAIKNVVMSNTGSKNAVLNIIRTGYDAAEFTGLPHGLETRLIDLKEFIGREYLSRAPIEIDKVAKFSLKTSTVIDESFGWYGFLGFFLMVPVILWAFFRPIYRRRIDPYFIYASIPVLFFLFMSYLLPEYRPYKGRYFLLPMAFAAPLVALLWRVRVKPLKIVLIILISIVSVNAAVDTLLHNRRRPLVGEYNVFNADYYRKRTGFVDDHRGKTLLRFVGELTVPGTRIGHALKYNSWDYTLFGRDHSRVVIPVPPNELRASGAWEIIERYKLDFLVEEIGGRRVNDTFDLVLPGMTTQPAPRGYLRITPR
ncbi:MAG: glycosyltransferase family 39 protein, partial [Thermodesulfobacteriota bacterium]